MAETIEDANFSEHTLAKIAHVAKGKPPTIDYSIENVTGNISIQSNLANMVNELITFNLFGHELSVMASSPLIAKEGLNSDNFDNPIYVTISFIIPNLDGLFSSPKSASLVNGITIDKVNIQVGISKDVENIADNKMNKDKTESHC